MSGLTVKSTPLKRAGGYTTTVPLKAGSAGELKPMAAGTPVHVKAGTEVQNRIFQGGRRGTDAYSDYIMTNVKRTIVP